MWPKYIFFINNFYKKRNFIFFNSTNFTVLEQAHYYSSLGVITSRCWEKIEYIVHFIVYFYIKCVALYRCFIHYNFHNVYKEMFGPVLFLPRCCQWTNSNIISLGTQLCRRNCLQVQRANITTRAKITPLQ